MHPLNAEVWSMMSTPKWTPRSRLIECQEIWGRHARTGSRAAALVAATAIHEMSGATEEQAVAVTPTAPTDAVLATIGPAGAVCAQETWAIIVGVAGDGPTGPLFAEMARISDEYRGADIFMYVWWGSDSLSQIAERDPDHFIDRLRAIQRAVGDL